MQLLSERPATTEDVEKEADMAAVCDLADDLRDVIVEYQVRKNIGSAHTTVHSWYGL